MSEPEATAKQNAGKILVVDDEPALTVAFARKLRREGYECATAGSGEEALKRLESYRPDLVISDVRMPGMSGLDLLKEIKHRDPALKVILTTAYAHIEFVVEALRHGVDDYLVKPFSLSELAASVSRAFEQPVGAPLGEAKGSAGPSGLIAADGVKRSALGLLALAKAFEARDHFTHGHAERVAEQATATGAALGLEPEARRNLWFSAVLHDVGKLRVAETILNKPGPLSEDEWQKVRQYPTAGGQIIEGVPDLEPAREGILHHRENWDGSGYPLGLTGAAICLAGRIINVADAFDSMLQDRPYRKALDKVSAVRELELGGGARFDPTVLEAFLKVLR
ncbi:MAG: HD domain-containing phosphohydrolase [Gemmatimonadota bacterium]